MRQTVIFGVALLLSGWLLLAFSTEHVECKAEVDPSRSLADKPLPVRAGSRVKTSGRVPHVQIGVKQNDAIYKKLVRLAFELPDLDKRPTIVSMSGVGMWLTDKASVVQPAVIVAGREFAHIHPDGSLHAPLPLHRAIELASKGWGELHPWANQNTGWEGLVMLYSASTDKELETLVQLITESYNHVTGRAEAVPGCWVTNG